MTTIVLVACGSTARLTKAQYERQLTSIGTSAGTTLSKLFSNPALLTPKSLQQAAGVVRQGASTIDDAASKIQALKPPPDAQADNDQLAKAFRELADELRQWATDAEHGNVDAVKRFDEQLRANELPGELLIQRTIDDLKKKGYRAGT
jgi:hypothetical protein